MISVVWLLILDGLVSGFRKLISWEFHTQMVKKRYIQIQIFSELLFCDEQKN